MNRRSFNPSSLSAKRNQGGFSLIEMAIALAIAAAVLFGIFYIVSVVQNKRITNAEAQSFNMMVSDVRTKFGSQGSFTGITPQAMVQLGVVPRNMVSGATIVSGFNTIVAVAAINLNGTAADAVEFTYTVPRGNCADFATASEGAASRVTVGGTAVKNVTAGINAIQIGTLATSCDAQSGGNVAIAMAQGR